MFPLEVNVADSSINDNLLKSDGKESLVHSSDDKFLFKEEAALR